MTLPLLILAIGSIFSGIILSDYFIGKKQDIFWHYAIILSHDDSNIICHLFKHLIIKSSVAIGVLFAALIYFYKEIYPKILSYNLDPYILFL